MDERNERTDFPDPRSGNGQQVSPGRIESAPIASSNAPPRLGFVRRLFRPKLKIGSIAYGGSSPAAPGWFELEAAREAHEALLRLCDLGPNNVAIWSLRRVETLLLIYAVMKRQGVGYSGEGLTARDWANAERIEAIRSLLARLKEKQRVSLQASLAEGGSSYLLQLDRTSRRRAARTLALSAQHLRASFRDDRETIERFRFRRRLGIGLALLLFGGLCWLAVSWVELHRERNNLAFRRPVSVSSAMEAAFEHGPWLVDGDINNVGFHTTSDDPDPWAMIDFGTRKRFSQVVVYNRRDCCKERQVPMVLEVSDDGVKFEVIAERQVTFDKWTVKGLHASGRYLRMHLRGHGPFHLAEVAVYE